MYTNITIKTRLISTFGVLLALLIVIGAMGLFGMSKTNDDLHTVYVDRTVALSYISDVDTLISANRIAVNNAALFPTEENINHRARIIAENVEKVNQLWAKYTATVLTPEEKALADKFAVDRARFRDEGLLVAMKLLREQRVDEAREIIRTRFSVLAQPVVEGIAALTKIQTDTAKLEYEQAVSRYELLRQVIIGGILCCFALVMFCGVTLFRAIINPLSVAQDVSKKIATGDFTSIIRIERDDEAGKMLESLAQMQNNVRAFIVANEAMAKNHAQGFLSERINASQFTGSYHQLALDINALVNSHITVYMRMVEVTSQYAKGNFSVDMDRLPGEKAKISAAVDGVKNTGSM